MAVGFSNTNKPINPRGNDQSPKGYNRAALYSGKALDFDGVNDYVDIGQNLGFINTGDFTFLANAKFDVLSGDECIMGQGSAGAGLAVLALVNGNGFFRFAFYGDDLDWDEPVETGKWYSLAFTFNRTTKARAIYVNGQLAASDVSTLTPNASINNFAIGKVPYSATYADAQITGVKVFSTALTAAQVADLYNNPEKVVPTGVDNTALKLWLPMMEGAGTTAYDGSGNGNHGTISGATYVNGVGAPVSQSAVIDWNKGTNLVVYSEQLDDSAWNKNNLSISANDTTAPDGQNTADKITVTGAGVSIVYDSIPFDTENYMVSVYVKPGTSRYVYLRDQTDGVVKGTQWYDLQTASVGGSSGIIVDANIESANNGFYRISLECDSSASGTENLIVLGLTSSPTNAGGSIVGEYVHAWGFQAERKTTLGPYIPTLSTAQTSDVLLPQGLTSGRDITGVNLFENVRKQGALNLDGNSWAEVHDNASLDVTTAITLEAWVYADSNAAAVRGIMGKWTETAATDKSYLLYADTFNNFWMFISSTGSNTDSINHTISSGLHNTWVHIVGTFDGTNLSIYVNGSQENTKVSSLSSINASDYPLDIARYDANTARIWEAPIAQPRIYNRALTAEEVLRNYNSGKSTYQ